MDTPKNFRSALNGFNREDVVRYIEYMNARHAAQINEISAEVAFLRSKLTAAESAPAQDPQLLEQLDQAREENRRLQERCDALEAQPAQSGEAEIWKERCAALETELEQVRLESNAAAQDHARKELEAYRRAERTERLARERAEQVYNRVNGVLADATVKVDQAAERIGGMSDHVMEQLKQLQEAVAGSKQALDDAAQTMYTIRPQEEE